MPILPENIIDRIAAIERRLQHLSTAVNTRPAMNTVSGGTVAVANGGSLVVQSPNGDVAAIGALSSSEYGVYLARQDGHVALSIQNSDGTSTSLQPIRIFDAYGNEIVSDDIATGGLARPWLGMLPPQDTNSARWPQTTATSWTTIAQSLNPLWQPKMRLVVNTAVSSGASGQVRVMVNGVQWGATITAGTAFDATGPIATTFAPLFGTVATFQLQAQVTSTGGTVYAQAQAMYGTQT